MKLEIPTPGRGYWRRRELGYEKQIPKLPKLSSEGATAATIRGAIESPLIAPEGLPTTTEIEQTLSTGASYSREHKLASSLHSSLNAGRVGERLIVEPRTQRARYASVTRSSADRTAALLGMLFNAMEANGANVRIDVKKTPVLRLIVGNEDLGLSVTERVFRKDHQKTDAEKRSTRPWNIPRYDYSPSSLLTIQLHGNLPYGTRCSWRDGKRKKLEDKTAEIVAGMHRVAATQAQKRTDDERRRLEYEEQRRRREEAGRIRRLEKQRAQHLEKLADQWAHVERLRTFVALVESRGDELESVSINDMGIDEWLDDARQRID